MSRVGKPQTILNAVTATGEGTEMNVNEYRHLVLQVATSGSANCTIKVYGSISADAPDWEAAASPSNAWAPKRIIDLDDGSSVDGSTGVVLTGTDIVKEYKINTDGLRWLNLNVTAYSAGAITVLAYGVNDNV